VEGGDGGRLPHAATERNTEGDFNGKNGKDNGHLYVIISMLLN
jgi:hypothetical protein